MPVMPGSDSQMLPNCFPLGPSFSSFVHVQWSVPTVVSVPSARPRQSAWRSAADLIEGITFG